MRRIATWWPRRRILIVGMDAREEVFGHIGDWIDGKIPVAFGDGRGFRAWLSQTRPELVPTLDALGREPVREEPSAMTPHLREWRRQATVLEVSPEAQKGLMFLTGLIGSFVIEGEGASPQEKFEVGGRLSQHFPEPPSRIGWRFDYRGVAELLEEMARNLDPSYLPPRGASPVPGPLRLPRFDSRFLDWMIPASTVHRVLAETIGRSIAEGLERSFLAGCRFVQLHGRGTDMRATFPLALGAYRLSPPHVRWLLFGLRHPIERFAKDDFVGMNLWMFAGTDDPDLTLKTEFSNHLIDAVPSLSSNFWDGRPADYLILVIKATWDFVALPRFRREQETASRNLLQRGLGPLPRLGLQASAERLMDAVDHSHGLDLRVATPNLPLGACHDRRSLLLDTALGLELRANG